MAARLLGTTSARIALLSDVQLLVGASRPATSAGT